MTARSTCGQTAPRILLASLRYETDWVNVKQLELALVQSFEGYRLATRPLRHETTD